MIRDDGLDVLLDMNGTEYHEENGYWWKVEAWKVTATKERPNGISYCLTFHDNHNQRILGYDNAHAVKVRKSNHKYTGRIIEYDHYHEPDNAKESCVPYTFKNAHQLLTDFLIAVNEYMDKL